MYRTTNTFLTIPMAASPANEPLKTLPLPTELICQILSELTLYDRRSFGLCSASCYKIVSENLFETLIIGNTLGTTIIADQILRSGSSRRHSRRIWRRPLGSQSLIMLSRKGELFGDMKFLSEHFRMSQQLRCLHIGLPSTAAWKRQDLKILHASRRIGPMHLSICLENLPNLTSISLYAPVPFAPDTSSAGYEGLDIRLYYFIISQFAASRKLDHFEVNWCSKLDKSFFGAEGYFELANGSQILPLKVPGNRGHRQNGAPNPDYEGTEILLCGPPSASSLKLNFLPGSYPIRNITRDEYQPIYNPPYASKRPQGGRRSPEAGTFEVLLPRMLYSILLPSVFARTLIELELRLDTCVCCCSYNVLDMPHLPLAMHSLGRITTQLVGMNHAFPNLNDQPQMRKFDKMHLSATPLKKFAYYGVRCTGVLPSVMNAQPMGGPYPTKVSWLNYAAEMWWESLTHLTVIETKYPHAGFERSEKYGREPAEWDRNIHIGGLTRLNNLQVLKIGYKLPGDRRDEGWVVVGWKLYDSLGNERNGEDHAELLDDFQRVGNNAVVTAVFKAVEDLNKMRNSEADDSIKTDMASESHWIDMEGHNYEEEDDQHPTPLLTPLETARQAYYRGGRKRRTREIQRFSPHMPALKTVEWVMHGIHTPFIDFASETSEVDDLLPDRREVELAQTVCFIFKIDPLSAASGGVHVSCKGLEDGEDGGWGTQG